MIVVVTGGRDYGMMSAPGLTLDSSMSEFAERAEQAFIEQLHVFAVLDQIHLLHDVTLVRNGGMTGADCLSSRWAYTNGVDTECYGARWGVWERAAGPARNSAMLSETLTQVAPDLVVAFPGGRGTANCVDLAKRRGISVHDART